MTTDYEYAYYYREIIKGLSHADDIALAMEFAEAALRLFHDDRPTCPLTLPRRFTILRLLAHRADEVIAERARRLGTTRAFYTPRDLRMDLRAALLRVLPAGTQTYRLTHDLPACAARFYGLAVGGAFAEGSDAAC